MTGQTSKTVYIPASPEIYAALDTLRRAKQQQTSKRVSLAAIALELIQTHPTVQALRTPATP
jgi:hypothetical protein